MNPEQLHHADAHVVWHPFTAMQAYAQEQPPIIAAAEGFEVIDLDARRYLDGTSSLWCNVHGHRVPAIDQAIRQQLDRHRSNPSCAVCHNKIDPPGFALENFDVLGGWREHYRSTAEGPPVKGIGKNGHSFNFRQGPAIDASAVLLGGAPLAGIRDLKRLLAANDRQVARNLVRQFVLYATGSPVSFTDRTEVDRILQATAAARYGVRSLIHEIVQSELFRSK